jgi:hypothetical protein
MKGGTWTVKSMQGLHGREITKKPRNSAGEKHRVLRIGGTEKSRKPKTNGKQADMIELKRK